MVWLGERTNTGTPLKMLMEKGRKMIAVGEASEHSYVCIVYLYEI